MMEFKLNDGKSLYIRGSKFEVEFADNSVFVQLKDNFVHKKFDEVLEEIVGSDSPLYLKKPKSDAKVIKLSEIEKTLPDMDETTAIGKNVFRKFMLKWSEGFGETDTPQPDRASLLNKTMSDYSLHVIRYVKSVGGLTHATMHVFPTTNYNETKYREKVRLLAENVAQVSSILCPPLSELLEYPFLIDLFLHKGETDE